MRPEERKMLESLAEKTVRRREEAEKLKEELNSMSKKVNDIMNKAENLKKLDLEEAESRDNDNKQDSTAIDATRRKQVQEEAQKVRNEMYNMIDELARKEFHPRNPGEGS